MSHLDDLSRFLDAPLTLPCPTMRMLAMDHEPAVAVGSGVLMVQADGRFRYRMVGKPLDVAHSLKAVARQRNDPYDALNRFRIMFTDDKGIEWNGGWTTPRLDEANGDWILTGVCDALLRTVEDGVAGDGWSEARFVIPDGYPAIGLFLAGLKAEGLVGVRHRTIDVLGNKVRFTFDPQTHVLTVATPSTSTMPAHAAENWLGEPLRILFGQPFYPRLVERRFPEGRSMLCVRPVGRFSPDSLWIALWQGNANASTTDGFFGLYGGLLKIVVRDGGWETNPLTQFYDHLIAVAEGERWVMALTLSSSIEGVVRMLVPRGALRPDANASAIEELVQHVSKWSGSARLKDIAIGAIRRADTLSIVSALRDLASNGVGTSKAIKSWVDVRNRVMHGEFVSPYSSAEDDQLLLDLRDLLHALTIELIRREYAFGDEA